MKTHRLADNVYTYTIGVPLTFIGLTVKTVSKFLIYSLEKNSLVLMSLNIIILQYMFCVIHV